MGQGAVYIARGGVVVERSKERQNKRKEKKSFLDVFNYFGFFFFHFAPFDLPPSPCSCTPRPRPPPRPPPISLPHCFVVHVYNRERRCNLHVYNRERKFFSLVREAKRKQPKKPKPREGISRGRRNERKKKKKTGCSLLKKRSPIFPPALFVFVCCS